MIRFLKIFGLVLIFALILFAAQRVFFSSPSSDRDVKKFVKGMNNTCPTMVDPETRLDKVFVFGKNNLQFNYTLVRMDKDSLPIPSLKKYMEPVIMDKIKNSSSLRKFIYKDLTWIYSYNDRNGDFIFKVTYTPDQFKQ